MIQQTFILHTVVKDVVSEIVIEKGLLEKNDWIDALRKLGKRLCIITDHRVRDLLGSFFKERLQNLGFEVHLFSVPQGEQSKTRHQKELIEDHMQEAGLGRDTVLISVGGGVVSDLTGFIASTYCRGIPFVSIPTTLLGQVDASIGGKVGVNTAHGKNLIGAFYHPRFIFIDPDTLLTLSPKEFLNGIAEVIKYALIASKSLFEKLEKDCPMQEYIEEGCAIKMHVVEQDTQECGLRRILNFGHTIGHAIETLLEYRMGHGEAIALGMVLESHMSYSLGYLEKEDLLRIIALFEKYKFSFHLPSQIDENALKQLMSLDKKALGRTPRYVVLEEIGKVVPFAGHYCTAIDQNILQEAFQWLRSR